ncbi:hypothetical protein ICE98_03647 [Lactococcus lactis]|nr:hypothetical protein [Lactococcus lactis]
MDWLVQRLLPIENVPAHKSLAITADTKKNNLLKIEGQISQDNKYPIIEFATVKGTDSGSIYSAGLQKVVSYLMRIIRFLGLISSVILQEGRVQFII